MWPGISSVFGNFVTILWLCNIFKIDDPDVYLGPIVPRCENLRTRQHYASSGQFQDGAGEHCTGTNPAWPERIGFAEQIV